MEVHVFARSLALAALTGLCLAATAGASTDIASSLRFGFVPQKAFQGQPASLSVVVRPTGVRCAASIRYADASLQRLPSVVARAGKGSWKWTIPAKARIGSASATVSCGKAGRVSRNFAVVGPASAPAKVIIRKSGFSQRVRSTSRYVSYGIVLANPSPENDALDVFVLVNFIDSTDRVVATSTNRVGGVGAGSEFYLGGSTSIPDSTPVSKLEIVPRIGSQAPKRLLGPPTSDVLVQPSRFEPGWVGAVVGQVQNHHPTMLLSNTQISAVVFDSAGNVIGGGTGYSTGGLLPGIRAYFSASNGVSSIPSDQAFSAGVSVLGRYEQTG
jgi:hypothetical protein